MAKNLVIVESPAKAKTLEKFLGKDFQVESSFGHIADLPSKEIGVDLEGDFTPNYKVSSDKKAVVAKLKSLAKKSEWVWLASDEDREGEAIAWHLFEQLNLKEEKTKRIVFHEITKNAILKAIENPRSIDYNLVNAQQARRVLDRLVGYELSPVLWKKVKQFWLFITSYFILIFVEKCPYKDTMHDFSVWLRTGYNPTVINRFRSHNEN